MAKKYQLIGGFPSGGVDRAEVEQIIADYLLKHPNDGKDGADGYSPIVTIATVDNGTEVTITDANGEHVFTVLNGKDGKDGEIDTDTVNRMVDTYLEENPPVSQITINGKGPDENGNFVINTQTDVSNNVVEF